MSRWFAAPSRVKSIATRALELPVVRLAARAASHALPVIHTLRYAQWFQERRIRDVLIRTPTAFGYDNRYLLYEARCTSRRCAP